MTADRTEAAANALDRSCGVVEVDGSRPCACCRLDATEMLAAADAHDRANGIARIRLDDTLAEKIARAMHALKCCPLDASSPCADDWPFGPYHKYARAVLDLLRNEALPVV